jgi:hypothetical protein
MMRSDSSRAAGLTQDLPSNRPNHTFWPIPDAAQIYSYSGLGCSEQEQIRPSELQWAPFLVCVSVRGVPTTIVGIPRTHQVPEPLRG